MFNNLVENHTANGNGLADVALHSHAPGLDLNGNRILNNSLSAEFVRVAVKVKQI